MLRKYAPPMRCSVLSYLVYARRWKPMRFIQRCPICGPPVTLQPSTRYSNSSQCTPQLWLVDVRYGLWNSLSEGLWHRRLVYLVFHISPQAEVAWSNVRRSRGPRNGSCSIYTCLLHFRRQLPLIVIGAPLAADVIINVPNKNLMSFLAVFKLFMFVSITFSKIHLISYHPNHL
jgi:hypothetical protein